MGTVNPLTVIDSIKKYISVIKTVDNKYFFATQNNQLLSRNESFSADENQFEFFDVKFGHKRQLYFKDITDIYLISFSEEFTPPMGRGLDNEKDVFFEISKEYIKRISLLDKAIFTYTVDNNKFDTVFNLIRYNDILKYYNINIDFIDKKILFFDEGVTDNFLANYKDKIFDESGQLKLSLSSSIILSFFDRETQEYILEDNNPDSRFKKLKSVYLHLLNLSREKAVSEMYKEKKEAIKGLTGIEKNYLIQNFDTEINRIRSLEIEKDLSYFDSESDLISYWPFSIDLTVGDFTITTSLEKNRNTGKILLHSVANTPFFNLYKVFKEYIKIPITLKSFEFLKSSSSDISTKQELINKKLEIFEKKRNEIFEFLDNELLNATVEEVKEDIKQLKEEINSAVDLFKKEVTVESSLRDILKYWPVYLYPVPEELVVE